MQTVQTDLVITGAHTPQAKVYWKGQEVAHVSVQALSDDASARVILTIAEDPTLAEMQAAGIVIRRV